MTRKKLSSRKDAKGVKQSRRSKESSGAEPSTEEETIATIENAAGVILAVTENRNWIEVFFGGDLMHTRTIDLPSGKMFNIFVEEIPHKTTVYEHPRTMIFFTDPCDLRIDRDGDKVIVMGMKGG
jgi:hypothetical protein